MNAAQVIAKLHHDRDQAIFEYIVDAIGEFLGDTKWLLSGDSHSRAEDNTIRYQFDTINIMRNFIEDDERQWPTTSLKNTLAKHYHSQGFEAYFDSMDKLTLRIKGDDIGESD